MRTSYFLRYTNSIEHDRNHPHSREYITLAQVAPEDQWESWSVPNNYGIDVYDPIYGEGKPTSRKIVTYDISNGILALEQPGLCGIACTNIPNDYKNAKAQAYWLGRSGKPWSKYLVLYSGTPVGQGYDSILFQPISVIASWKTKTP
jgi:hypothetical protein